MGSVRIFIAFDTPSPVKDSVRTLQAELRKSNADVRWELTEKLHATIKFLGDVDEQALPDVVDQVGRSVALFSPLDVVYRSLGAFPNKRRPRVIWIGCENRDGQLHKLKDELDTALLPFGFTIEARTFHPHITLGRVRSERGIGDLLSMLESLNFEPRPTRVENIIVVKSLLKPEGSEYSIVISIPLN